MNHIARIPFRSLFVVTIGLLSALDVAGAQRRRGFGQYFGGPDELYTPPAYHGNVPYDGRFTFARMTFATCSISG